MHTVLGDGPLARAVARRLVRSGPTVLGSATVSEGPWLWRHVDLATGQGVKSALESARTVVVALDEADAVDGAMVVLRRAERVRTVVAWPIGLAAPGSLFPDASAVALGPVWGPEEPWVAAWSRAALDGRRLLVPEIGGVRALAADDAVDAILAAVSHRGVRWTMPGGEPATMETLASAVSSGVGRPIRTVRAPLGLAAWWAGASGPRARRWASVGPTDRVTEGWDAPRRGGPTGWVRAADPVHPTG